MMIQKEGKKNNPIPIYSLLIANAISLVGNVFSAIAIPWFVLQTTGSAARTGITGFFTILPVVVAGFLGGTLIDRLGYKRTSIISDLASGVTTAMIPLLHFTIGLGFWQLMVLVFLGALLDTPGGTARAALLPELAKQAGMPIERATSLTHVIERGARLIGAPLAGLLISVMGTENVLWLDSASFFISAAIIWFSISGQKLVQEARRTTGYFDELREGLRFIGHDRLIFAIVIMVMLTNFLDSIFGGVVRPVYVNEVYGSALNLGLLIAANGGGAVIGGLIFAAVGHRLPRHAVFVSAFVLSGMQLWVYLLYPPIAVLVSTGLLFGMGAGPLNPIIGAVEFERIPENMRGRVFGAITAGAWIAMPLGMLFGGVFTGKTRRISNADLFRLNLSDRHHEYGFHPCHEGDEQESVICRKPWARLALPHRAMALSARTLAMSRRGLACAKVLCSFGECIMYLSEKSY